MPSERSTKRVIPNPVALARGKRAEGLSRTGVRDLLFALAEVLVA